MRRAVLGSLLPWLASCHLEPSAKAPASAEIVDRGLPECRGLDAAQAYACTAAAYRAARRRAELSSAQCEAFADGFAQIDTTDAQQRATLGHATAVVWAECGDPARSERAYRRVLEQTPDHVPSLMGLAATRLARDRPAEAVALLERALRVAPDDARVVIHLARAWRARASSSEPDARAQALARMSELLAEDARRIEIYELLALTQLDAAGELGPRATLLATFTLDAGARMAAQTGASRAGLDNAAGLAALARGDLRAARIAFERVLASEPEHAAANLNLAMLAVRYRDFAAADAAFSRALASSRAPADADARLAWAHTLLALGRIEPARRLLRTLSPTNDPRVWFALGVLEQDHVIPTYTGVSPRASYERAVRHFEAVLHTRAPGQHRALARAAALRLDQLNAALHPEPDHHPTQAEALALEEAARLAEPAERERLLELERKLIEAEANGN